MPYTIRFTDEINKGSLLIEDREINTTDTSLQFPGKQATAYGAAAGLGAQPIPGSAAAADVPRGGEHDA